jgi:hypothetical protein
MTQYPIDEKLVARLEAAFKAHQLTGDQKLRADVLRENGKALSFLVIHTTPVSREQSLALNYVELAVFYANAAIARHESAATVALNNGVQDSAR